MNAALASNGGVLPSIIPDITYFNANLKACNGEGFAQSHVGYVDFVENGCDTIAQALAQIHTPESQTALSALRSFFLGKGGAADKLGESEANKASLDQHFYSGASPTS